MVVNYTMWKNNYSEARDLFRQYCSKTYNKYEKRSGYFFIDGDKETTIDYLFLQKMIQHESTKPNKSGNSEVQFELAQSHVR